MKIEEVKEQVMYCLFAPDGSHQAMTLATDEATCLAQIKLLHKAKLSKSYFELFLKGFRILPIRLTMVQSGDENSASTQDTAAPLRPGFKPLAEKVATLQPAFWSSQDLGRVSELITYAHAHNREVGNLMRQLYTDFLHGKYCYEYNALSGHPVEGESA